jgi:hypothetical protein
VLIRHRMHRDVLESGTARRASLAGRVTQPPLSAPLSRAGHGLVEGHDPIRKHSRCRQILE